MSVGEPGETQGPVGGRGGRRGVDVTARVLLLPLRATILRKKEISQLGTGLQQRLFMNSVYDQCQ